MTTPHPALAALSRLTPAQRAQLSQAGTEAIVTIVQEMAAEWTRHQHERRVEATDHSLTQTTGPSSREGISMATEVTTPWPPLTEQARDQLAQAAAALSPAERVALGSALIGSGLTDWMDKLSVRLPSGPILSIDGGEPAVYTVKETARILRISESKCLDGLRRGLIPGRKVIGQWRISGTELRTWFAETPD